MPEPVTGPGPSDPTERRWTQPAVAGQGQQADIMTPEEGLPLDAFLLLTAECGSGHGHTALMAQRIGRGGRGGRQGVR